MRDVRFTARWMVPRPQSAHEQLDQWASWRELVPAGSSFQFSADFSDLITGFNGLPQVHLSIFLWYKLGACHQQGVNFLGFETYFSVSSTEARSLSFGCLSNIGFIDFRRDGFRGDARLRNIATKKKKKKIPDHRGACTLEAVRVQKVYL